MMRVNYSPQSGCPDGSDKIGYEYGDDRVTAHLKGHQETWNFQAMPDGEAESLSAENIEICPILSARREGGILYLTLIHRYIDSNSIEQDTQFREVAIDGK